MCDRHSGEEVVDRDTPVTADVGQDLIGVIDGADPCSQTSFHTVETAVYQQDERGAVGHHSSVNFL